MICGTSCFRCGPDLSPSASRCSAELREAVPGQPSVGDVVQAVLKECRKENPRYKVVALRCAAGVLQATREDRFQELADIVFPMIKKVTVRCLGFSLFPVVCPALPQLKVKSWLLYRQQQTARKLRRAPVSSTSSALQLCTSESWGGARPGWVVLTCPGWV